MFHLYFTAEDDRSYVIFPKDEKKLLYLLGKKFYNYTNPHSPYPPFNFPNVYAVNEADYRFKKSEAFRKRTISNQARKWLTQRNAYIKYVLRNMGLAQEDVAKIPSLYGSDSLSQQQMSLIAQELETDAEMEQ